MMTLELTLVATDDQLLMRDVRPVAQTRIRRRSRLPRCRWWRRRRSDVERRCQGGVDLTLGGSQNPATNNVGPNLRLGVRGLGDDGTAEDIHKILVVIIRFGVGKDRPVLRLVLLFVQFGTGCAWEPASVLDEGGESKRLVCLRGVVCLLY